MRAPNENLARDCIRACIFTSPPPPPSPTRFPMSNRNFFQNPAGLNKSHVRKALLATFKSKERFTEFDFTKDQAFILWVSSAR